MRRTRRRDALRARSPPLECWTWRVAFFWWSVMFLPKAPARAQGDIAKANCAGVGCEERVECRRYLVRIGEGGAAQWASFDVERAALGGACPNFKRLAGAL